MVVELGPMAVDMDEISIEEGVQQLDLVEYLEKCCLDLVLR